MIPRFAIFHATTSTAYDCDGTGPEFEGRALCITWGRWTLEITIARKNR